MVMIRAMATDPAIGIRIKKRRQVLGMTQEALADRLNVSKSTVANWERGKHFPLRYLGAIEHVLQVTLEEPEPAIPTDPEERALWDALDYMDDPAQRWKVIGALRQARDQAAAG